MHKCPAGTFPYTIQPGDDFWLLAQRYNTTVQEIAAANQGADPNNLLVGQVICIPERVYYPPDPVPGQQPPCLPGISKAELDLSNKMRLLWEQHVAWTRMTIISIAEDLPDVDLVTRRLLRNPRDFEAILKPLYGPEKAAEFA